MGEEKQQGENRAGNGSAQGRRPVSGRSSIYGSKESQQMMKRSAQHSAQARRRVQTGEEKRAVSGYEKRTKKEGVQSENVKAGVEKRRSGQTASGVPAERNIKKAERTSEQKIEKGKNESSEARRTSLTESEGVSVRPERKKVSGSLSISENGNAPKKSRKSASEEQKAGSSKKTESEASTPRPHIGSHKFLSRCLWGLGGIMHRVYCSSRLLQFSFL